MAAPLFGQITTTGLAVKLDSADRAASCAAFILKAPLANSTSGVFIGDSTVTPGTGHVMDPGDQIVYERLDQVGSGTRYTARVSDLYAWIVSPGDKLTWLAFQ